MHSMDNNMPSPSSHLPSILKKGHGPVITTEHAPKQPLAVFIIQKCKYHWQINGFVDDQKVGNKSKQNNIILHQGFTNNYLLLNEYIILIHVFENIFRPFEMM